MSHIPPRWACCLIWLSGANAGFFVRFERIEGPCDFVTNSFNSNTFCCANVGLASDPSVTLSSEDIPVDVSFIREFCEMP